MSFYDFVNNICERSIPSRKYYDQHGFDVSKSRYRSGQFFDFDFVRSLARVVGTI